MRLLELGPPQSGKVVVVDVDELVEVLVEVLVLVEVEEEELVLVDELVLLLDEELDVLVEVLVVEGDGGVTVRLNGPLDPPHDPAKPSTTIMYVWPAVTVGVTSEP